MKLSPTSSSSLHLRDVLKAPVKFLPSVANVAERPEEPEEPTTAKVIHPESCGCGWL